VNPPPPPPVKLPHGENGQSVFGNTTWGPLTSASIRQDVPTLNIPVHRCLTNLKPYCKFRNRQILALALLVQSKFDE
jgi:hypothetical protein